MRHPEEDIRADRHESTMRVGDLEKLSAKVQSGDTFKVYKCSECSRLFEERSVHCPWCNRKTMGQLRRI